MLKISLFIVVYIYSIIHLTAQNETDYKWMDSMIRETFPFNDDEVPSYKIASVTTRQSHRSKREIRPVEIQIEDKIIHLNLHPLKYNAIQSDMSLWCIVPHSRSKLGHYYQKITYNTPFLDGTLYEDPEKKAMMFAFYKDHDIYYDGVIQEKAEKKVIRSLLEKWWFIPTPNFNPNSHVVFDTHEKNNTEVEQIGNTDYFANAPKLAKPLEFLEPKLLLLIESDYFKAIGSNIVEAVKYLSLFWNLVNSIYSEIPSPKVRILITGIIILLDNESLDFVQKAFNGNDTRFINRNILLGEGKTYFDNSVFTSKTNFTNFDSVIFMTNHTDGTVTGSAQMAKICDKGIIFASDNAMFAGVDTAAHELGHSLGLRHDGYSMVNTPFNSTIMAPVKGYVEKFYWSQKSLEQLKAFATTKMAECLDRTYRLSL